MSDVTPKQFRDEVLGSFETYWTAANPTVPIAYPNLPFDPESAGETATAAWVRIVLQGSEDPGMERLSNSVFRTHWRRSGRMTVEVYVREGCATDVAYDLADDVMAWMENPDCATAIIRNISAPVEIGPDGTWFQLSLSADWFYHTDRAA